MQNRSMYDNYKRVQNCILTDGGGGENEDVVGGGEEKAANGVGGGGELIIPKLIALALKLSDGLEPTVGAYVDKKEASDWKALGMLEERSVENWSAAVVLALALNVIEVLTTTLADCKEMMRMLATGIWAELASAAWYLPQNRFKPSQALKPSRQKDAAQAHDLLPGNKLMEWTRRSCGWCKFGINNMPNNGPICAHPLQPKPFAWHYTARSSIPCGLDATFLMCVSLDVSLKNIFAVWHATASPVLLVLGPPGQTWAWCIFVASCKTMTMSPWSPSTLACMTSVTNAHTSINEHSQ